MIESIAGASELSEVLNNHEPQKIPKLPKTEDIVEKIFKSRDSNNDGIVTSTELPENKFGNILKKFDTNLDGALTKDELINHGHENCNELLSQLENKRPDASKHMNISMGSKTGKSDIKQIFQIFNAKYAQRLDGVNDNPYNNEIA